MCECVCVCARAHVKYLFADNQKCFSFIYEFTTEKLLRRPTTLRYEIIKWSILHTLIQNQPQQKKNKIKNDENVDSVTQKVWLIALKNVDSFFF